MALFCIRKYHILCIAKGVRPKSIFRKWKMKSLCDIQKPCEREEKSQRKDQLLSENMCMRMLLLCFALLLVGRCVCYLFFSFFIRFVVVVAVAIFFVVTDQLYWQSNKKRVKNENDKKGRYQSQYNKNWIKWRKSHVKNGCIKSSRDHIFTKTCVHHMCAPFFFTQ